jgi:hypothetical protein
LDVPERNAQDTSDLIGSLNETLAESIANKNRLWALRNALAILKEQQVKHKKKKLIALLPK